MLRELHIENLAIIEKVSLEFGNGLNIITGETGAGKSLLIDALRFISGERTKTSMIRQDCDKMTVIASFEKYPETVNSILDEYEISAEENLLVRRTLSSKATAKNFINDTPVSSAVLKIIFDRLVEMHGQFENQYLLFPKYQLEYLDKFCGCLKEFKEYSDQFNLTEKIKNDIEKIKNLNSISHSEIEWKKFQYDELSAIKLTEEKYDEISCKIKIAEKSQNIIETLGLVLSSFQGSENSPQTSLAKAAAKLKNFAVSDKRLADIVSIIENAGILIDTLSSDIQYYIESLQDGSFDFDEYQKQLFEIQKISRKYKVSSIGELFLKRKELENELQSIDTASQKIRELEEKLKKETGILLISAKKLSAKRRIGAEKLSKTAVKKIKPLAMQDADFSVKIEFSEDLLSKTGCDKVEFIVKTNKGSQFKPLREIASGGEISRIMLALKSINADSENIGTIIFDEIDTGVSGTAASAIALELKNLTLSHQAMCVTHQPAIAAISGTHFLVEKFAEKNDTSVKVKEIKSKSKTEEIARLMAGGKITAVNLKAAEELIKEFSKTN